LDLAIFFVQLTRGGPQLQVWARCVQLPTVKWHKSQDHGLAHILWTAYKKWSSKWGFGWGAYKI